MNSNGCASVQNVDLAFIRRSLKVVERRSAKIPCIAAELTRQSTPLPTLTSHRGPMESLPCQYVVVVRHGTPIYPDASLQSQQSHEGSCRVRCPGAGPLRHACPCCDWCCRDPSVVCSTSLSSLIRSSPVCSSLRALSMPPDMGLRTCLPMGSNSMMAAVVAAAAATMAAAVAAPAAQSAAVKAQMSWIHDPSPAGPPIGRDIEKPRNRSSSHIFSAGNGRPRPGSGSLGISISPAGHHTIRSISHAVLIPGGCYLRLCGSIDTTMHRGFCVSMVHSYQLQQCRPLQSHGNRERHCESPSLRKSTARWLDKAWKVCCEGLLGESQV